MDDKPVTKQSDADILEEAKRFLARCIECEGDNREQALTDLRFGNGEQWEDRIKQDRIADMRPCLTINLTDAMVRRVTNACRENRPRIKVHAVSDGADKETAEVIDGLIRHIEYSSGADAAYDCALESAVRGGWGYIRLNADYVDETSFDQELKIERIRNPFTVYPDPDSQAPDGSDYKKLMISEDMPRDEYKSQYNDVDPGGWNFFGTGDNIAQWSTKDTLRVAEYFRIELRKTMLYMLSDGSRRLRKDLGADIKALPDKGAMLSTGLMIVDKRETHIPQLCWYKLTAHKILDRRELPGKYIPIIPVYGREMDVNGKVTRKGMIRDLRDPARMYNYAETAKTEIYALQPKAPWLIAEGQMEGHEAAWTNANRKPIVALPYKPTLGPDGTATPPPQRQNPPPVAAGFAEWAQSSQSNFLAVAGMPNEPGQDMKGEVVSGVALAKRQGLADVSHYDFYDNFTRSLRHLGRIIVNVLPDYYDTPRMARIVREDGTPESVPLNQPVPAQPGDQPPQINGSAPPNGAGGPPAQPQGPSQTMQAILRVKNDMTVGKYEVVVDTGPSYATKREESSEAMLELVNSKALGEMVAKAAGDLVIRGMDFPNSDSIANRVEAQIPGAINDPKSDLPQKAQAIIAGLQQQLQQMQQQLMAAHVEIKTKQGIVQMQEQGKTERDKMWANVELTKTREDNVTKLHDTEIRGATQLLNTHVEAAHDRIAARELIERGTDAEKT